jgi:hypothetical protein
MPHLRDAGEGSNDVLGHHWSERRNVWASRAKHNDGDALLTTRFVMKFL